MAVWEGCPLNDVSRVDLITDVQGAGWPQPRSGLHPLVIIPRNLCIFLFLFSLSSLRA